jgi:hypothetical protein
LNNQIFRYRKRRYGNVFYHLYTKYSGNTEMSNGVFSLIFYYFSIKCSIFGIIGVFFYL